MFSESFGKLTRIDDALPADLDEDAVRESPQDAGRDGLDVAVAGNYVVLTPPTPARCWTGTLVGRRGCDRRLEPYEGSV